MQHVGIPALMAVSISSAFAAPQLKSAQDIDAVVQAMSLEEKVHLLFGIGMGPVTKIPGVAGASYAIPRLGIPEIDVADGPVGLRLGGVTGGLVRTTTAYPIPSAMAATWDKAGMEKIGQTMGYEVKEYGVDLLLGPALNIQRDPLGGRNFEYYTEDPFLNGKLSSAFVKGLQSNGVGATLKHYAANNTETFRTQSNQIISERALREIYLPGFEMAIREAQPWAVMSSYPGINGSASGAESEFLQTEVLRNEWGFKGLVMSDWFAVKQAPQGVRAGTDLIMPKGDVQSVLEAVQSGKLDEALVDRNVKNILSVIVKTPSFLKYTPSNSPDKASYIPFIRQIAADGMVLLKNDQATLPVAKTQKIGLFGKASQHFIIGGGGSSQVNSDYSISLVQGLQSARYALLEKTAQGKLLQEGISPAEAEAAASETDIGFLTLGRFSSEGADKYSMEIDAEERALIATVADAYHRQGKKLVVLLNIGAPLEMASWQLYADAILLTWQPGQEAGYAVADVVSGAVNPSGRLPETFPVRYMDAPSFGSTPKGQQVIYSEGIYVGYRYYDTKGIKPAYPFGYGLSYTDFDYSNLRVDQSSINLDGNVKLTVSVDIQNKGKVAGKEVVQLYVQDTASLLDRPMQELKGFEKISLAPGKKQTVSFTLDKRAFSYFNESLKRWSAEPGKFNIRIGASSQDIRQQMQIQATGGDLVTRDLPWGLVQTNPVYSKIIAKYIGGKNINEWYLFAVPEQKETLGNVLDVNFDWLNPELKAKLDQNKTDQKMRQDYLQKRSAFVDKILAEINAQ